MDNDFEPWKLGNLAIENTQKKKMMATNTTFTDGILSRDFKLDKTEWTQRYWTSKGKLVEECIYKTKDICARSSLQPCGPLRLYVVKWLQPALTAAHLFRIPPRSLADYLFVYNRTGPPISA